MIQCPLCGIFTEKVLSDKLRRGEGIVYHCEACDLGFLVAAERSQAVYYGSAYRQQVSHKAAGGATTPQELFDVYSQYQADRVKLVMSRFKRGDSILDIGASAGQFLYHLHGMGRRCAIEPDAECCAFMEKMGIETDTSFLWDSKFSGDKFDVVCAFQTLEHVDYPVQFLMDVRAVMRPGGVVFIEVPSLNDPLRSVWGIPEYEQFYFHCDHLSYFTAKSIKLVAEKSGFRNPEVKFTQDYSLLNHLHWLMARSPQSDCHIGLGPVKFQGKDTGMAAWLSNKLAAVNAEYVSMLESTGQTSNLMLVLQAD